MVEISARYYNQSLTEQVNDTAINCFKGNKQGTFRQKSLLQPKLLEKTIRK